MTAQTIIDNARTDLRIDPGKNIWTDTQLLKYLNEGVSLFYQKADFKFRFKDATITPLVNGQASYTLPTDYGRLLWVKTVDAEASSTENDETVLENITDTLTDFQQTYDMNEADEVPQYVYEENGKLYLWPIPNADTVSRFTLKYKYSEYPTVLTLTASPDLPSEWHFVFEFYVRYRAWSSTPGNQEQQNALNTLNEWEKWSAKAAADILHRGNEKMTYQSVILPSKRLK